MAYKYPVSEPIAIVGSSCRFAGGVTSPCKLWRLLLKPTDLSRRIPKERFNVDGFYHKDGEYHGTTNSPKAYFLDQDHRVFDATFFNITPKEAEAIDPQQRMLLECVYEALESAGYTLHQFAGKRVAVFAGLMTADYDTLSQRDDIYTSQYYATGNARSIMANRVSYFFNFRGPSMTIDTACSSSLVALHQAVLSLRAGESEMACVTGANLIITPEQFIVESSLHMLSPTGHCRMWDASANGYARGEGISAVFIKTLSKAIADGDRIEAIIRETGVNSDGRSKGITMPNWKAQADLIQDTYRQAALDPKATGDRCQYFEAHGTGTAAGDPNEARAIEYAFFGQVDSPASSHIQTATKLVVGSVKTVIGHTEGAAGLAGLLKVVHAMKHGTVPPNLHLDTLNPAVEQYCANLIVPTRVIPWPQVPFGQPKRASVNSFGFGGTNSHAIVEEYVPSIHTEVAKRFHPGLVAPEHPICHEYDDGTHIDGTQVRIPLVLSATSQASLGAVAKAYRDCLLRPQPPRLEQLAWHSFAHRTVFPYRTTVSGTSVGDLVSKLEELIEQSSAGAAIGVRARPQNEKLRILGIFTGQGAQWVTMSRGLLKSSKVYGDAIRALDAVLRSCPDPPTWSLEQEIGAEEGMSRIHIARISQPLCTAVQIALVDLLRSLCVSFHAVIGHSSGEIAAAYAAGKLCARDAILISYYRGMFAHLAGGADGRKGGMLAASLSREEAAELCAKAEYRNRICMAASNAPSLVTLSGDINVIHRVHEELKSASKFSRILQVDTAYHSPHMEAPSKRYVEALKACGVNPLASSTGTSWISSVYGKGEPSETEITYSYWGTNMVDPVLFCEAVESALDTLGPFDCAIEVGPHPSLKAPATQTIKAKIGNTIPYAGLLDRTMDDRVAFSQFLGWMWTHFGSSSALIRQFVLGSVQPDLIKVRLDEMPIYPWDHSQQYYRESRLSRQHHFRTHEPHELLGVRTRDDNDFELRWRNILKLDKVPWIEHHSFEGQALLPASAYLVMALDAAKVALAGRSASIVELRDVTFPSGISLEKHDTHGVEVLFSLAIHRTRERTADSSVIDASFTLTSALADGTTSMKKNFEGKLRIFLGNPGSDVLPTRPKQRAETLKASPEAFYHMMAGLGLKYTGPFKGLTQLQRRFAFASGTVQKLHDEDTTQLSISPATLDSCLQTAFLSVSSPGDGAIWTSFLPERIEQVRFNLAICDTGCHDDTILVDAFLMEADPYTRRNRASFTADLELYNDKGNMEIQVQGLTIASWSPTKPEDDYELYLTSTFDIDPEDAIVTPCVPDGHIPSPMLVESCNRVASYYYKDLPRHMSLKLWPSLQLGDHSTFPIPTKHWPAETEQSLDAFIRTSPHYCTLDFIRQLGRSLPDVLSAILPTATLEAHELVAYQQHVSRVVRQIAHKYPRMNVLGLLRPEMGLTEHVLAGLGDSFSSYIIGAEPEKNLEERVLTRNHHLRKKILIEQVNFDADAFHVTSTGQQDLVLADISLFENRDKGHVLRNLRELMRPGGFLILLEIHPTSLKDRIRDFACCGKEDDKKIISEAGIWDQILQDCGFVSSMRNSDQEVYPGFTLKVRESESVEKQLLLHSGRHPAAVQRLTKKLLIIGGTQLWTSHIAARVQESLAPYCGTVTVIEALDYVEQEELTACSAAILLSDIGEPILSNLTKIGMDNLRSLLRPEMTVLWITQNARFHNPENAASFGFTRTLAAETPGLTLQMLDLDQVDPLPAANAISETFIRLAVRPLVGKSTDTSMLWIYEPEIHLEDGYRLVPRVVPWKEGIQRANAGRRVVTNTVNTLENRVEIRPTHLQNGTFEYRSQVQGIDLHAQETVEKSRVIQVDYSTAEAFSLTAAYPSLHVCLGREVLTGESQVALSTSNASYITRPPRFVEEIPPNATGSPPLLLALIVRYIVALAIASRIQSLPVLLFEPDPIFQECAKDVFIRRGIVFRVFSSDEARCKLTPGMVFAHSHCSAREMKSWYPPGGSCVFNFLPEASPVSQALKRTHPKSCEYGQLTSPFDFSHGYGLESDQFIESIWTEAVSAAISKCQSWEPKTGVPITTAATLLARLEPAQSFDVLDWMADRWVEHIIQPVVGTALLDPWKTYVLVGITRDFGQSLCTLFIQQGARNIVLASRNPPTQTPVWQQELLDEGYSIRFESLDVTSLDQVLTFKSKLAETCPPVGGIVNGAMVLDDRVFSEMPLETFQRVMRPKALGSKNLDTAFGSDDLEFFIMTSSFAAIGGHAGQANYAAANMYMNGLAAARRARGKAGSVLNIGVIWGLGFLHREKEELYEGLSREGYPPISERDIHHMFIEAIAAGKPEPNQVLNITTGLRRFPANHPTQFWQRDPRFSHFSFADDEGALDPGSCNDKKSLKQLVVGADTKPEIATIIQDAFIGNLQQLLQIPKGRLTGDDSIADIGVDSLIAVEIRGWFWKNVGQDVAVMKVLGASSIAKLCQDVAASILDTRITETKMAASLDLHGGPSVSQRSDSSSEGDIASEASSVVTIPTPDAPGSPKQAA
ncbi:Nonribosomal peptide synthetase 14 [Podospora aff. communis PSN243]|uniref:Nonribosomal peptide synthetase 14 n=1 Tax=Podospora aff. communis PSN243 TaxID=3040156 RepID=A0AAV9GKD7_9PEZI|nr:Nonribosomal peptide synthetase 14 [Podospora aff. communis PSN243]